MFGFLNVYKPKGITSHEVVAILRRTLKIKQIGHTGTLDPFAEGVLPVCIGKATRLIEYLNDDKAYIGLVQFGKSTTTYDIEGVAVNLSNKTVCIEQIEKALVSFIGEIEQLPPIYSAIKVKGKKLYEYARKNEEVKIEPRKVTIYDLKILDYDFENRRLTLYIKCSKGTYIRSLANDLGEKLGVYGYLMALERVQAGDFYKENSVKLEKLNTYDAVKNNLINPLEYLVCQTYEINPKEKELISHGISIPVDISDGATALTYKNNITATGFVINNIFKPQKVFIQ